MTVHLGRRSRRISAVLPDAAPWAGESFPAVLVDSARAWYRVKTIGTGDATRRMLLTHTRVAGRFTIRLAVGAPGITADKLRETWATIRLQATTDSPSEHCRASL